MSRKDNSRLLSTAVWIIYYSVCLALIWRKDTAGLFLVLGSGFLLCYLEWRARHGS